MSRNPESMTKRKSLSTKQRVQIFSQGNGRCYLCQRAILPRETWECEHPVPFAIGGADSIADLLPVHTDCHGRKTSRDVFEIAKTKRIHAKHIGAKKPTTRPMMGTKASGWKKPFGRPPERRT